jgi:hypothetical protein
MNVSMSEFEKRMNEWEEQSSPPDAQEQRPRLPDDFSSEELAFAQELDALFDLEGENIPPYFIQTLLEADDKRFAPVEAGFEQRTRARVFRRLNLRRELFPRSRRAFPVHRPALVLIAACLVVMIFTVATTANSFAAGWNILWSGAHSGVVQVSRYPGAGGLAAPKAPQKKMQAAEPQVRTLSLVEAQQQLHFPMYWPDSVPTSYALSAIYLHQEVGQTWADGPILELNYSYTAHGIMPHGSGRIVIWEFKPLGNVFQVVQLGAARLIQIDEKGNASAIYVDGQWERINRFSHAWVYGERSELIYERDGVIFWIAGDQRDGIDSDALSQIASSLQALNVQHLMIISSHMGLVMEPVNDSAWSFADDVVYFDSNDGPLGPTVSTVGAVGSVGSDQPALKGGIHPH